MTDKRQTTRATCTPFESDTVGLSSAEVEERIAAGKTNANTDVKTKSVGQILAEHSFTLFNAVKMGKSLTWPRPSYDGRYLLFTLQDYGYFSVWHNESDQWLLDLQTGEARPLTEANSNRADSYHNWNVNSHWVVFTSRRGDGLYTRLYLMSIDEQGRASKPFLLPQRNPWDYYDGSIYSFNTPDFTKTKVDFNACEAGKEISSDKRVETHMRH